MSESGFDCFFKLSHVGVLEFFSEPIVFFSGFFGDHP